MSGMTAHPATQQGQAMGAYEQTLKVLGKLESLVQAAGGHRHNIIKTVVYLTDIADKDEVGRARRDFFAGHYPCSTLVAVLVRTDDKRRGRLNCIAHLLGQFPYADVPHDDISLPDRVFNPSYERKVLPPELYVPQKY